MVGDPKTKKEAKERTDIRLPAAGSGSDYVPFLQHAGIASLNFSFGGEEEYGQYHSIYDSFDHYIRFMDPDFQYGIALAGIGGRCVLRFANAEVLPFEFTGLADNINAYVKELQDLANQMREETATKNEMIENKVFGAYFDSSKRFVPPESQENVPHLNFAPLMNAAANLEKSAREYQKAYHQALQKDRLSSDKSNQLNSILMFSERALTKKEGLPNRPWFTHQIYAPGVYTGYAAKALPAVREDIEQRKWSTAEDQIRVVSQVLENFTKEVKKAKEVLD